VAIVCVRCSGVLRRYPGLCRGNEPFVERDGDELFLTCPRCGLRQAYFPDAWARHTEIPAEQTRVLEGST
jgi:hypothetical protein